MLHKAQKLDLAELNRVLELIQVGSIGVSYSNQPRTATDRIASLGGIGSSVTPGSGGGSTVPSGRSTATTPESLTLEISVTRPA